MQMKSGSTYRSSHVDSERKKKEKKEIGMRVVMCFCASRKRRPQAYQTRRVNHSRSKAKIFLPTRRVSTSNASVQIHYSFPPSSTKPSETRNFVNRRRCNSIRFDLYKTYTRRFVDRIFRHT